VQEVLSVLENTIAHITNTVTKLDALHAGEEPEVHADINALVGHLSSLDSTPVMDHEVPKDLIDCLERAIRESEKTGSDEHSAAHASYLIDRIRRARAAQQGVYSTQTAAARVATKLTSGTPKGS
jgi:hypothetical protein